MARESKLNQFTDSELRELGAKGLFEKGLYASVNGAWNALYLKPNGRLCGESPVKAEKTTADKKAASQVSATPATPVELFLPGRVQDYFYLVLGVSEETKITREMVEEAINENSTKWSPVIRRLCPVNERPLLDAFIGYTGATLAERISIAQENARMLPYVISNATIDTHKAIDDNLRQKRERFESLRYDSDISAFYAG